MGRNLRYETNDIFIINNANDNSTCYYCINLLIKLMIFNFCDLPSMYIVKLILSCHNI